QPGVRRGRASRVCRKPTDRREKRGHAEKLAAACGEIAADPADLSAKTGNTPAAASSIRLSKTVLVQMMALDRLRWGVELTEVVDGQAEGDREVVRGSPLRPRSHHPMRALVSSVQAQSA